MPFLLLPLDVDRVPLTYAIRFRGKLLPVLGTFDPVQFRCRCLDAAPQRPDETAGN
jgi:hypothetical protein